VSGAEQRDEGWRVEVTDDCMSSQQCVMTAPDLFTLDEDGFSHPVEAWVPATRGEDLRRVIDGCPVGAVRLI
jgi:ferredoxin